jgi:hypothetical protein
MAPPDAEAVMEPSPQSVRLRHSGLPWIGIAIALALGVAVAGSVNARLAPARGPLEWDEGGHVWKGYLATRALGRGDFAGLVEAAGSDPLYPPLHTSLLAGWFAVFGASERSAYALSAASLAIAALLMALLAWPLGGWLASAIATLLVLGSPLHVELAGTAMLELPGTAFGLLTIAALFAHVRSGSRSSALIAGLAMGALFLYKYNFGLMLAAGVALFQVTSWRRPEWRARPVWLWAPLLIGAVAWLAPPGRIDGLIRFAGNRSNDIGWLPSLVFYPSSVLRLYAAGPTAAAMVVLGIAGSLSLRARPDVRLLAAIALAGLGMMTVHPFKFDRSIVTIVPAVWLIAAAGVCFFVERFARGRPMQRTIAAAVVLIALAAPMIDLHARQIPALARSFDRGRAPAWSRFPWPGRDLLPVQAAIVGSVDPGLPVYIAGEFNELSPTTLQWKITERFPNASVIGRCFGSGTTWKAPLRLVTLEVVPGSRYDTGDYREFNAWAIEPIHAFEKLGVAPARRWDFEQAGVRLRIYRIARLPGRE